MDCRRIRISPGGGIQQQCTFAALDLMNIHGRTTDYAHILRCSLDTRESGTHAPCPQHRRVILSLRFCTGS
jgi:hypothetical protein